MFHLTKTSGYAIHALSCIGVAAPRSCIVRSIAKGTGLQKPYLSKIINQLVHHGLVKTKRGYRGGVLLARPPEFISLLEVVHAIEGDAPASHCLFGLEKCPVNGSCPAHKKWNVMRTKVEAMLGRIKLIEVMQTSGQKPSALMKPVLL